MGPMAPAIIRIAADTVREWAQAGTEGDYTLPPMAGQRNKSPVRQTVHRRRPQLHSLTIRTCPACSFCFAMPYTRQQPSNSQPKWPFSPMSCSEVCPRRGQLHSHNLLTPALQPDMLITEGHDYSRHPMLGACFSLHSQPPRRAQAC